MGTPKEFLGLTAGAYTIQGKKLRFPSWPNQDVHLVVPITSDLMLVAIFDGHGREGHRSASRVRSLFEQNASLLAMTEGEALLEVFRSLFRYAQRDLELEGLAHYS